MVLDNHTGFVIRSHINIMSDTSQYYWMFYKDGRELASSKPYKTQAEAVKGVRIISEYKVVSIVDTNNVVIPEDV